MNLVLSGPVDPTLLNLAVARTWPREVVQLHANAHRLIGATDDAASRQEIERICDLARVDYAFVPEGLRFADFKLLAMDMDSTLITIECIDEIADFAGKKKEVAAITEAAMRGEIPDFAESLRRRVALLAGVSTIALDYVLWKRLKLSAGAKCLILKAQRNYLEIYVLSGGFTYFCKHLKVELGLSGYRANELEIVDGYLSGHVNGNIIDGAAKADALTQFAKLAKLDRSQLMVIGDGANDIPMMQLADASIAYHAKAIVNDHAQYKISYGGLDVVNDWLP